MRVLVTGASGFVGTALCRRLLADGYKVRATSRSITPLATDALEAVRVDLESGQPLEPLTDGCAAVMHLAGRAHLMSRKAQRDERSFISANAKVSERLALSAIRTGVTRFVYLSSIKVNGESTLPGRPFRISDPPAPVDAYGRSKAIAEEILASTTEGTKTSTVVIRPPLVYGPGVRANFEALIKLVASGLPLPFGAVRNRRSLVSVDNLCDLLITAMTSDSAKGRTFLASDDHDLSTPALIELIAAALGRRARLFALPLPALQYSLAMVGLKPMYERLTGSLEIDISHTAQTLHWSPPFPVSRSIAAAVKARSTPLTEH